MTTDADGRHVPPATDDPYLQAIVGAALFGDEPEAAKIGRFTLLDRIGAGGMGTVYAAFDAELDRKVAVKLLHDELRTDTDRQRIVREAQAMAKLSHPNVAQVYEVGEHHGQTFLAMEFIDGVTLRDWQREPGRRWRDILAIYTEAGRGLRAAHEEGLVHRDFKPDNAIVAADGRPRVLDFGLARVEAESATTLEVEISDPGLDASALNTPLTRTGAVMGTPAYMAPEQILGEGGDARTDQFSFCVALYEALYRERPFEDKSPAALRERVLAGKVRTPPKGTIVPGWLRTVLLRGLQREPSDRYASMAELLEALGRDPTRRRRRLLGVGAVALLVGSGFGAQRWQRAQAIAGCEREGASITEVWNAQAEAELREALEGSGLPFASTTADKTMPWLEKAAQSWQDARARACVLARVDETLSERDAQRVRWCLEDHRQSIEVTLARLSEADDETLQRATTTAARLPPASRCLDPKIIPNLPDPPAEGSREAVRALSHQLAEMAPNRNGPQDEAAKAVEEADALGWQPLQIRARLVLAERGNPVEGHDRILSAYTDAARSEHWDLAADAAIKMVHVVGVRMMKPELGLDWAEHAKVALALAGDEGGAREYARLFWIAELHQNAGRTDEAIAAQAKALAHRRALYSPDHPLIGDALTNMASASNRKDPEGAAALYREAKEVWEQALGPDHPNIAVAISNLAGYEVQRGDYEAAIAMYEEAYAIREEALGPDASMLGSSMVDLGWMHTLRSDVEAADATHRRLLEHRERTLGSEHAGAADAAVRWARSKVLAGDADGAIELATRSLKIYESKGGKQHPILTASLEALGRAHLQRGELERASAIAERIVEITTASPRADHYNAGRGYAILAEVASRSGRHDEAVALIAKTIPSTEALLGEDQLEVGFDLSRQGVILLAAGDLEGSIETLERALGLFDVGEGMQPHEAQARFGLARALTRSGGDEDRARSLAEAARDHYREAGPARAQELAEVEAWLAGQGA